MYAFCDPTMYAFEPVFSRQRCSPCTPSFFFLLPFLLFFAGPMFMMLVFAIKAVFLFFAPLAFMALAFKTAKMFLDDDKPTCVRRACRRFPASACAAAACAAPADKNPTRGEKSDAVNEEGAAKRSGAVDKAEEGAYEIHIAAPGVRAADVTATLDHANVLRVSGRSATLGGKSVASVDRSVRLPADADVGRIALSVENGLVYVKVDKKAPRVLRVLPTAPEAASSAAASGEGLKGRAIPVDKKAAASSSNDKDTERRVNEKKTQTVAAPAVGDGGEAEAAASASDGASSEDESAGFVEITREEKKAQ